MKFFDHTMRNKEEQNVKLFKNHKISLETKKRLIKCYIRPILLYGSECWTISTKMRERLEAAEMWFYRRILRISYTQHVTNERVLERMSAERELIKTIRVQQMKFFGHIMRNKEVENMIITGKIEGKRSQGKQRLTFTKSLSNWIGINEVELTRAAQDRQRWKAITSEV